MNEKATIYDYARMCERIGNCTICPLSIQNNKKEKFCDALLRECPDEANEIILKWCKEHPAKTRQSKFLEMFPNAKVKSSGVLDIPPCSIEKGEYIKTDYLCSTAHGFEDCSECYKEYWLEVDENE